MYTYLNLSIYLWIILFVFVWNAQQSHIVIIINNYIRIISILVGNSGLTKIYSKYQYINKIYNYILDLTKKPYKYIYVHRKKD